MWSPLALPDGTYSDIARPWSQQDIYNYLPVFAEGAGTRSPMKLVCAPGLEVFANVGDGPHRGGRDVEGTMYVVSGHTLYKVSREGVATSLGTIPGSGPVSMTHNQITDGNEVVIGNGLSGYVYNTVTAAFAQITDDAFPGFRTCDFLGQYILGVEPMRRYWFHSDLVAATSYSDLNRYAAETSPDRIVGLVASHNEALVFGERTIEPWANDPTENAAFQLNTSAVIEKGCAAGATLCRLDNSVFFLGSDKIVYRLQGGYTPVPISTKPMEASWRDLDASRAFAFTFEDRGHVVYYLTFPDGQTWGYDVSVQRWHRRQSFLLNRWRLNTLFKSNGEWYGGDFQSGKLYRLRWGYVYEGCELMPRGWVSGVMHNNGNRLAIHGFKMLMDTGGVPSVAQGGTTATLSGRMPDGYVGDVVDFHYTLTLAYPGQVVTITATGLPTGLSIDNTGHVTGTLTEAASFTPSFTITDGCSTSTYSDSVVVAEVTEVPVGVRPRVVSWWDFESDLVDQARGGNNQAGTVSYEATATATGNRLAEGTVPISTATNYGFNLYYGSTEYANCAFGARLTVSKLSDVTRLITVGADSGTAVTGVVSIGISAAGKWQARVFNDAGAAICTLDSTTAAVVDTETHVGFNCADNGAGNAYMTCSLWINGVQEASEATVNGGALLQTNGHYVIGTREGTGYRPAISEMFWTHATLLPAHWEYLHNSGNKRFYADFGNAPYGTTYDACLATLMAAKSGGIYKLNATSGTAAADSATYAPTGAATLMVGAAYSTAVSPPPAFGSDHVVALGGTNDRVKTNSTFTVSTDGPGTVSMNVWAYQTANGSAGEQYFNVTDPAQYWTGQRLIKQGANASELVTYYNDFSGNEFVSATVSKDSRLNAWRMLTYAGFAANYFAPVLNGIMVGKPGRYALSDGTLHPHVGFTIGADYTGASAIQGYVSRACVVTEGNFALHEWAELYDLGMGSA